MPLFCRKNVHSLKTLCSHFIFWIFVLKTPCCYAHILSKKVNSVKTKRYYGPKKLIRCPFFPSFANKSPLSCPYFAKKRWFSKKHAALMSILFQKNGHSLKNTDLWYHSCQIFHGKRRAVKPIFGQKPSIWQN